jgi:hypothetical protein
MILEAGLPPCELVRRLVSANRTTAMGNRALAFYLHDMQSRGEHHALSFASAAHFAMARLEMGKTAAYELVSLGAALDGLPRIDAAFCDGEISWSKVKLLCGIAVPETEIAWLELGKELNCRQLAQEVASTERGRPPRKNRRGLPHLSYVIKARVDATRREILEAARRKLQDETGEFVHTPDLLTTLAERYLRSASDPEESGTDVDFPADASGGGTRPGERGNGHGEGGSDHRNKSKRRSSGLLFQVVIERCPDCHDSLLHTEEGPVCLSQGRGDMIACCEAKTREVIEGRDGKDCSTRMDIPTPSWMREAVLLRDGMKCVCCEGRNLLMAHHVDFRSNGGRTVPSQLCSLCALCRARHNEHYAASRIMPRC